MIFILLVICSLIVVDSIRLPDEHYEYYARNNSTFYQHICASDQQVSNHLHCNQSIDKLRCWGYETDKRCRDWSNKYHVKPVCFKKFPNYEDLNKNKVIFYNEADFGYLENKQKELKVYCKPIDSANPSHSSLQCTDFLRFCEGKNIFIDFRRLNAIEEQVRYRTDVLDDGDVGGIKCELNKKLLREQNAHKSPLQSWYEEIEHFTVLNESSIDRRCDLTINRTTYIMKLDATVNMYHHFCDFINLYVTLHMTNDFSVDKQILIWNTYHRDPSNFAITWNAFTRHPLLNLDEFKGKTVCFKHVVFPFLPRMIYGLYYNIPLISGCKRSGLFHAFNRHILNGLDVLRDYSQLFADNSNKKQPVQVDYKSMNESLDEIRITFLSRTTEYRKVLNENELINAIRNQSSNYKIIKVDFNHRMPFKDQLKITSQTDILIGMHGAGLTHLLFLPDWAVLFELFNCDDQNCYKDLARLRGLKYITWRDRKKLNYIKNEDHKRPAHLKFTDYRFDKDEFMKRVNVAIKYVKKKKLVHFKKYVEKLKKTHQSNRQTVHSPVNKSKNIPKIEL